MRHGTVLLAGIAAIALAPLTRAAADTSVNAPLDLAMLAPADAATTTATTTTTTEPAAPAPHVNTGIAFFPAWQQAVAYARSTQPEWSSPLVTTTAMLEQRFRFDASVQHAGNGSDTTVLDGGKGIDLIVGDTQEIQIAAPPYDYYSAKPTKKNKRPDYVGFGDWSFLRFKQRIVASPEDQGNYIVSAWLQVQAPTGISKITNHAWSLVPTIGFGKGVGPFDVQGSIGASIPTAYEAHLGIQVVGNLALQLHLFKYFWPQIEFNNTDWSNGQRSGLDQIFFTPGVVIGRIPLVDKTTLTLGAGYQTALTPNYQAKPLTPQYDHAWIFTMRIGL